MSNTTFPAPLYKGFTFYLKKDPAISERIQSRLVELKGQVTQLADNFAMLERPQEQALIQASLNTLKTTDPEAYKQAQSMFQIIAKLAPNFQHYRAMLDQGNFADFFEEIAQFLENVVEYTKFYEKNYGGITALAKVIDFSDPINFELFKNNGSQGGLSFGRIFQFPATTMGYFPNLLKDLEKEISKLPVQQADSHNNPQPISVSAAYERVENVMNQYQAESSKDRREARFWKFNDSTDNVMRFRANDKNKSEKKAFRRTTKDLLNHLMSGNHPNQDEQAMFKLLKDHGISIHSRGGLFSADRTYSFKHNNQTILRIKIRNSDVNVYHSNNINLSNDIKIQRSLFEMMFFQFMKKEVAKEYFAQAFGLEATDPEQILSSYSSNSNSNITIDRDEDDEDYDMSEMEVVPAILPSQFHKVPSISLAQENTPAVLTPAEPKVDFSEASAEAPAKKTTYTPRHHLIAQFEGTILRNQIDAKTTYEAWKSKQTPRVA